MITATLLASFGIALAPQDAAGPMDLPTEVQGTLDVSLQMEKTRIAVRSFAQAPVLMIVASATYGTQQLFWLPPGAVYNEEFPRGTLDTLQVEVLSIADGVWSNTGAFFLGDFLPQGSGQLWALDCGHVLTRTGEGAPLTVAASDGSLLPDELLAMTDAFAAHGDTDGVQQDADGIQLHVPVPTPTDRPQGDKPPRKRHGQLPPI